MVQLLYGAVFYEGIGYTDTSEMGNIVIVRQYQKIRVVGIQSLLL